ncbi:MAG: hypothetical protein M1819_000067 [Sarea resinae]|nr:MAG: hypothetical protein M1819_000067 [Sarea resinae]
MISLLDLLNIYPVAESIVASLPLGDLLQLVKVNSAYRDVLHAFPPSTPDQAKPKGSVVAPSADLSSFKQMDLHLGQHQTKYWRNLKTKARKICSEPQHTKGPNVRGCVMCSMPVCEGCVVRASFGKQENTFFNRKRHLCQQCWACDNPHSELRLSSSTVRSPLYSGELCNCSARDGWLCLKCKTEQITDLPAKLNRCYGVGCHRTPGDDSDRRRICLWCGLPLPPKGASGSTRQEYESRHLYPGDGRIRSPENTRRSLATGTPKVDALPGVGDPLEVGAPPEIDVPPDIDAPSEIDAPSDINPPSFEYPVPELFPTLHASSSPPPPWTLV